MCCGLALQPSPLSNPESRYAQHSIVITSPAYEYAKCDYINDGNSKGACCVQMRASVRRILSERTSILLWSEVAKFAF